MMEIPDALLRRIVREAVLELGPEADAALLRKVVKEVIRHLEPKQELTSFQSNPPPQNTRSPY